MSASGRTKGVAAPGSASGAKDKTPLSQGMAERYAKLAQMRIEKRDPYPNLELSGRESIAAVRKARRSSGDFGAGGSTHRIAGRVIARRKHGRVTFADLLDGSGTIEICAREDVMGSEVYGRFRAFDVGDIIGVEGHLGTTRRDEPMLFLNDCALMTKALRQPPVARNGRSAEPSLPSGSDRVFELISDGRLRDVLRLRSQVTTTLREVMQERGFIEVETPILQSSPAGASARPFLTQARSLNRTMALRISPQLYLRRCLVGGLERVFDLGKCFRNEGVSFEHSPEFTLLEWSMAYANYRDAAELAEHLLRSAAERVLGTTKIVRDERPIDLGPLWRRMTVQEAILNATGVDCLAAKESELAEALDSPIAADASWGTLVALLYSEKVEPTLFEPTIVFDFPIESHSLVKGHPDDPRLGQSFDVIVGGMEIASGDSELNDPAEQIARFENADGSAENPSYDPEVVIALQYGLAPSAGAGLGLDRVLLLLTGCDAIRDVIPFPALSGRR